MPEATQPPYFAVIFSSLRNGQDEPGYRAMAARMEKLAQGQRGFLGLESYRDANGRGVTVSYWESRDAIAAWRSHPEHLEAQLLGKNRWYQEYRTRVCRVEDDRQAKPTPLSTAGK